MNQSKVKDLIDRDLEILAESNNYLDFQFDMIERFIGKRILEVGSGIGNHTVKILGRDPELVIALEKEIDFCKKIQEISSDKVVALNEDLDNISKHVDDFKSKRIDTVIALNVLEHIENDIACLESLSKMLTKGGRIIMIVPACKILYSELDKKYGHYRRYNKSEIADYAERLGMNLIEHRYINVLGFFAWLICAKIGNAKQMHQNGMRLFNKIVPFISFIEKKITKWPFGLSLIFVLERKEK